jgi:hypothetical protein
MKIAKGKTKTGEGIQDEAQFEFFILHFAF